MSSEMETAALASMGGVKDGQGKTDDIASKCLNCGEIVRHPYCGHCGQLQDDFHRPLGQLIRDGASDLFSLDGRIIRTLPALLFRPGHVTRNFINGQRMRYVPPFRLYLLTSLFFFLTLFAFSDLNSPLEKVASEITSLENAVGAENEEGDLTDNEIDSRSDQDENSDLRDAIQISAELDNGSLERRILSLLKEPKRLAMLLQSWSSRISILLVPLTVVGLGLAYANRQGVFLYDHIIAALHYQTFIFFLIAAALFEPVWVSFVAFFFIAPLYFYRMQRVVYGGGRMMTVLRTSILWVASLIAVLLLIAMFVGAVVAVA